MKQALSFLGAAEFRLPFLMLLVIAAGLVSGYYPLYLVTILLGLLILGYDSVKKLWAGHFSLDYIAILAMVVALIDRELVAGAVISLMVLVSKALEAYGSDQAEAALKHLVEKIPKTCRVKLDGDFIEKNIQDVRKGEIILIRRDELVPLDGHLLSGEALMNEANLTGEMEPQAYHAHQFMKSGLVNAGPSLELQVAGEFSTSAYQKIVELVHEAKRHPAQIVRLAERYNYGFTVITLLLAGGAYMLSHDMSRLLAVLVIATPCPLLIAAPVSFLGGMNKASRKNIIVKRPAALETLSRVTTIFFDKTGTLTLGEPTLSRVEILDKGFSENGLIQFAAAIELHSLHPLAKAFVRAKEKRGLSVEDAERVTETIGKGISGSIRGKEYLLVKSADAAAGGLSIDMFENGRPIGRFMFDDVIKHGTAELLMKLKEHFNVAILTGDSEENATRLFGSLGVKIHARCLPEDKFQLVHSAQAKDGDCVMMVGDGLNDAPALALADVGVVFSGTENSASIDAASIAILSHDVRLVEEVLALSVRTTKIARESMLWGIGLSVLGMVFALFGFIPPVSGAIVQEGIDVAVIFNALRTIR